MKTLKKFFLSAILMIGTIACSKEETQRIVEIAETQTTTMQTKSSGKKGVFHISQKAAELFVSSMFDSKWECTPYVEKNDTLFYVFNFTDGWKIITSDMRTNPVIGECEKGHLDLSAKDNTPFEIWKEGFRTCIRNIEESGDIMVPEERTSMWQSFESMTMQQSSSSDAHWVKVLVSSDFDRVYLERIDHLIPTEWGQDYPWNQKTPTLGLSYSHAPAGCVAVAYAQMLYYFYHTTGQKAGLCEDIQFYHYSSFPTRNYQLTLGAKNYNSGRWGLMKTDANSAGSSVYVADFLTQVGREINTYYTPNISTANFETYTLNNAGLDAFISGYSFSDIHESLQRGLPLILDSQINAEYGHCWIIDGFISKRETYNTTYAYYYVDSADGLNGMYNGYIIDSVYTDEEIAQIRPNCMNGSTETLGYSDNVKGFLMNWGWDGEHNSSLFGIEENADWLGYVCSQIGYNSILL